MIIRQFRETDVETVMDITVVCFAGVSIDQNIERVFGRLGETDWRWRKRRSVEADVQANSEGVFVAEEDGRVIGYVTTILDRETRVGRIPNMAVLPMYRRRGVGEQLMRTALRYFKESGIEYAKVEALEQNEAAQRFYPKIGFQEVARQIHYFMRL